MKIIYPSERGCCGIALDDSNSLFPVSQCCLSVLVYNGTIKMWFCRECARDIIEQPIPTKEGKMPAYSFMLSEMVDMTWLKNWLALWIKVPAESIECEIAWP